MPVVFLLLVFMTKGPLATTGSFSGSPAKRTTRSFSFAETLSTTPFPFIC